MAERAASITLLLQTAPAEDPRAFDQAVELLVPELHDLAGRLFRNERPGHTLQPTVLVSEAYLRLRQSTKGFVNRRHFFAAVCGAMRRILVEHARRKQAQKRGGGRVAVSDGTEIAWTGLLPDESLEIALAIEDLEQREPVKAEILSLWYLAGHTQAEIAGIIDLSERQVQRHIEFINGWLATRGHPDGSGGE